MDDLIALRRQGIQMLAGVAWLATLVIAAGSLVAGSGVLPPLMAAGLAVFPTLAAQRGADDGATRIAMGMTMPLYSAILLYQWAGHSWLIDLHMTFFAMIAMLAALADWRPVLAGAAVTAVHHLVLNALAPQLVFGNGGDFGRVVLHAVVVVMETGVLLVLANRLEALLLGQAAAREETARLAEATEHERAQRAAEQQLVVDEIAQGLRKLAAGDLTATIEARFPAAFEALRGDFNQTLQGLNALVGSVAQASDQIRNGASEIRVAADDLSRRTEVQASSIEQATHSISGLASSASATAARASDANQTLAASQDRAGKGYAVMARAMETMERIERSANEIGQIVTLIDGIAFQTNLLALNAGVEAARAGDAGKGFAVVANEVRALAQRAADAATDIKALISTSNAQVLEGVDLVTQGNSVLEEVMNQVGSIGVLVSEIAVAASGNAEELAKVRETFALIDRSTQQNAAMVEESNAALRTLASETDALSGVVSRFTARAAAAGALRRAA